MFENFLKNYLDNDRFGWHFHGFKVLTLQIFEVFFADLLVVLYQFLNFHNN